MISLGTTRGEFEIQALGEMIEHGEYGPFKYTVIISTMQYTQYDPQLSKPHCTCDCEKPQLIGIPCSHVIVVCQYINFDVYRLIDEDTM
jgi:SWIM zinc finger